ncbi:MAG: cellulase family glycosylhydrolase [Paludibacteraceae bacterium]|nr:cellulase family glycosylhydrolase [Paludibacteraceae bacterium]
MRKFLLLVPAVTMSLAVNAEVYNAYADWGQLKLVDNQLSSKDGEPIQLKGWSTQELQLGAMDGCTGAAQWNLMHQYGANVVRLAMGVDKSGAYLSDPDSWKSKIKTSISEIAEEGMYCVVDWNILETGGYSGNPNDFLDESKDFFAEISKYCADNGYSNVLYEICNEPICGWAAIKKYAEDVISVIVKNQPEALVIVGTDQWCQRITEPINNPIDAKYKQNVLYSFHYYACSHFSLLGDFRGAQKFIPVFVSEWSAVSFNGTGTLCENYGDALLSDCKKKDVAPQLVSWCFWNWGKSDESSSSFKGECKAENLSKYDGSNTNPQVGEYAVKVIDGSLNICFCAPENGPYEVQNIPNTKDFAWKWDYFDIGGEGYAYHDENSSAYVKDAKGNIVDYAIGDECDAYSQAYKMQYLDKKNPWYTISKDDNSICKCDSYERVSDYKDSVKCTTWDGIESYLSLNAGKKMFGVAGSGRPDEGVDLGSASLLGTSLEYKGYNHLMSVEAGEWINYTVNVDNPGLYKLQAYVSDECKQGGIGLVQERGNIIRSLKDLGNKKDYTSIHFEKPKMCADSSVVRETAPWDCWNLVDALDYDDSSDLVLAFIKEGIQELRICFNGVADGVGPLVFTYHSEIPEIVTCCDDDFDNVESYEANMFSIVPNPTSGEFTVTLAKAGKAQVEIINVAGQVVYSAEIESSATISKALSTGIYTVVVKSEDGINTQKLVVK